MPYDIKSEDTNNAEIGKYNVHELRWPLGSERKVLTGFMRQQCQGVEHAIIIKNNQNWKVIMFWQWQRL